MSLAAKSSFEQVSAAVGSSRPPDLDAKFLENQEEVEIFNASIAADLDAVRAWNELYGMTLEGEPLELFNRYLDTGDYVIFQSLVDHPAAADIELFARCSVVFQRGDIFLASGRQDLFLRSYFHNAKSPQEFVNFAPNGGVHLSFETDAMWYPLEVTALNSEPTSVVLNVMTPDPLDLDRLPDGFKVERRGRMRQGLETFQATTLTATFPAGASVPDVRMAF